MGFDVKHNTHTTHTHARAHTHTHIHTHTIARVTFKVRDSLELRDSLRGTFPYRILEMTAGSLECGARIPSGQVQLASCTNAYTVGANTTRVHRVGAHVRSDESSRDRAHDINWKSRSVKHTPVHSAATHGRAWSEETRTTEVPSGNVSNRACII